MRRSRTYRAGAVKKVNWKEVGRGRGRQDGPRGPWARAFRLRPPDVWLACTHMDRALLAPTAGVQQRRSSIVRDEIRRIRSISRNANHGPGDVESRPVFHTVCEIVSCRGPVRAGGDVRSAGTLPSVMLGSHSGFPDDKEVARDRFHSQVGNVNSIHAGVTIARLIGQLKAVWRELWGGRLQATNRQHGGVSAQQIEDEERSHLLIHHQRPVRREVVVNHVFCDQRRRTCQDGRSVLIKSNRCHVDTRTDDLAGIPTFTDEGDLPVRARGTGIDPAESCMCLDFHVQAGIVREGNFKCSAITIFADSN